MDNSIIYQLWEAYSRTIKPEESWTIAEVTLIRTSFMEGIKSAIQYINDSEEHLANQLRNEVINENP